LHHREKHGRCQDPEGPAQIGGKPRPAHMTPPGHRAHAPPTARKRAVRLGIWGELHVLTCLRNGHFSGFQAG
ncbi:hypothetical protein DF186_17625, partial [Enterococcus hirae]